MAVRCANMTAENMLDTAPAIGTMKYSPLYKLTGQVVGSGRLLSIVRAIHVKTIWRMTWTTNTDIEQLRQPLDDMV